MTNQKKVQPMPGVTSGQLLDAASVFARVASALPPESRGLETSLFDQALTLAACAAEQARFEKKKKKKK